MKQRLLLLSPFLVLLVCHLASRIAAAALGVWAWIPLALVYWGVMGGLIAWRGEPGAVRRWIGPAKGRRGWTALAIIVGFIPLSILILNIRLLADPLILVLWLLFALINPWFEEGYWRGLMTDLTAHWPRWASISYTTILFTASHPLLWGVFSVANRDWMALVSLLMMGAAWAIAYQKSGTLRWAILSHLLVDLGNLAVPVFLNLYIPPHLL